MWLQAARLGSGLVPETFCLVAGVKTTATTWKKALLVQGENSPTVDNVSP